MNELQTVSFDQAQRLKAAGFNWEVDKHYDPYDHLPHTNIAGDFDVNSRALDGSISAPTVALALKWMRDVKGIANAVNPIWSYDDDAVFYQDLYFYRIKWCGTHKDYVTHEEAENALLDELLNVLETKKNSKA